MLLKSADTHQQDLEELTRLLALDTVSTEIKKKIEYEIRKLKSGIRGETEAAYNINFHYAQNKNWAVIHDLRIEYQGEFAQIDHLLFNRFMEVYVCESKRFCEGIEINEYGEFSAFYQGKPYGIPSPLEQNNRHIELLTRLFSSDVIDFPLRLGLKLKPKMLSLILVANSAQIIRPKNSKKIDGLDRIIKNEQVYKRIRKDIDEEYNPFAIISSMSKMVSAETVQEFAQSILRLHKPLHKNWRAYFGIADELEKIPPISTENVISTEDSTHLCCEDCQRVLTPKVITFCQTNETRFKGRLYCFNCQKNY